MSAIIRIIIEAVSNDNVRLLHTRSDSRGTNLLSLQYKNDLV